MILADLNENVLEILFLLVSGNLAITNVSPT